MDQVPSQSLNHDTRPKSIGPEPSLDALPRTALVIRLNSRRTRWTSDGGKTSFGDAKEAATKAGAKRIDALTFHDARGTAVVNLALAGCSVPEIVSITGHSLKDAESILDAHYLGRDRRLGELAISDLEEHSSRTQAVNGQKSGSTEHT